MEATHIPSNPRSVKLGELNKDDDDENQNWQMNIDHLTHQSLKNISLIPDEILKTLCSFLMFLKYYKIV